MLRSPLRWGILFILLWLPVNFWASADKATSWESIGYLLIGVVGYFVLTGFPPLRQRVSLQVWLLIAVGGTLATVGAPFVRWKPEFRLFYLPFYDQLANLPRFTSETIHANLLAGILVLALPLLLANLSRLDYGWLTLQRWSMLSLCLIIGFVFVLTQSRGGYMGLLFSLIVFGLLRWPRLRWGLPVLFIGIILLSSQFDLATFLNAMTRGSSLGGWPDRLDIWTQSARAIQDFVFTGIGIGTFTLVIPLLYPLRVPIEGFPHAHNLFLQVGLDLGVPGLIAYLSIVIACFAMLIRLTKDRADEMRWLFSIGATSALVGMLVHGIFDAVLWGTKVAFTSWLLFALITSLYMQHVEARDT